jgi:predicted amidohydrolase
VPVANDLVIFPEMFLTGFSMNTKNTAQTMSGEMVTWMRETAKKINKTLIGSLPISEDNKCFNRLLFVMPEKQVLWYDKRHLFRMGEEPQFYAPGKEKVIIPFNGWNIRPLICYDLRFPVWSRNVKSEYDMLIYVTNWPEARNDAYLSLLKARAIENMCFVIGTNRIGTDGNNIKYCGNSIIFDPKGNSITNPKKDEEAILNGEISLKELRSFREKFPAFLDGDEFEIKI